MALHRLYISLIISVGLLAGCASGLSPVEETFSFLGSRNKATEKAVLSPKLKYLRVLLNGQVSLLVLGYLTPNPNGTIETWYSADGEVIKLQAGRVVGTAGLFTDWREVRFSSLPNWRSVADNPATYSRDRDEMPGYRVGIHEDMTLRAIPPPSGTSLQGLMADHLRWFEESAESTNGAHKLPPSRYAIEISADETRAVYGEQCFSEKLCISWQRWPVGR